MQPIKNLRSADIFRDGGSYQASFDADSGARLVIYLETHPDSPSRGSLRHNRLFAYEGKEMPTDATPVQKKSQAEDQLLRTLRAFLQAPRFHPGLHDPDYALERLTEMVSYIQNREDT